MNTSMSLCGFILNMQYMAIYVFFLNLYYVIWNQLDVSEFILVAWIYSILFLIIWCISNLHEFMNSYAFRELISIHINSY
jgi:hypothetical protein